MRRWWQRTRGAEASAAPPVAAEPQERPTELVATLVSVAEPFERRRPHPQNVVDLFAPTWRSAFPETLGVTAGSQPYFDDRRVQWAADRLGGIDGRAVLELGPFEAYNTFHLARAGAVPVVAIEANRLNYLKCLVVKELLGFQAEFRLGDFLPYLEETSDRYALCFAAGVLYHQTEPLRFLRSLANVAPAVYLWTHYFDENELCNTPNWRYFDGLAPIEAELDGFRTTLFPRSYRFDGAAAPAAFSGGTEQFSYWMSSEAILSCLRYFGFGEIEVHRRAATGAGPVISLLART